MACLKKVTCRRFLNRLLGVEVARQNLLFNYFLATLAAEVKAAKEEGRYSEGVSDLPVSDIKEPPTPEVCFDSLAYQSFNLCRGRKLCILVYEQVILRWAENKYQCGTRQPQTQHVLTYTDVGRFLYAFGFVLSLSTGSQPCLICCP